MSKITHMNRSLKKKNYVFPMTHTAVPPYLYTVCTDSCSAVPHIPSNNFITLCKHFKFSSTHLIRPYTTVL